MSCRVDGVDDDVGADHLSRLELDGVDALLVGRPVAAVDANLEVDQRGPARVRQRDRRRDQVQQLGAETQTVLQRQRAAERPQNGVDQILRQVLLALLVAQREVRVVV